MTTAVVDNMIAWRELFTTIREDIFHAHLPLLRHVQPQVGINTSQQELIYHLTPHDAITELIPQVIEVLNRGGLQSRRLVKALMRLNEASKWLESKTPFYKTVLDDLDLSAISFSTQRRSGEMSVKYAVLKFFILRLGTLAHLCEQPELYARNMNDSAVYHWIFTGSDTDTRYDSLPLLREIEAAHVMWLVEYHKLLSSMVELQTTSSRSKTTANIVSGSSTELTG